MECIYPIDREFLGSYNHAAGRFTIVINPGEPTCSVMLPELKGAKLVLNEGSKLKGTQLELTGVAYGILKLKA